MKVANGHNLYQMMDLTVLNELSPTSQQQDDSAQREDSSPIKFCRIHLIVEELEFHLIIYTAHHKPSISISSMADVYNYKEKSPNYDAQEGRRKINSHILQF